jgi:hypothetical protein
MMNSQTGPQAEVQTVGRVEDLLDAFDTIAISVYQFVSLDSLLDLRPDTFEKGMKIIFAHIAEAKVNNSGWRTGNNDAIRKISIIGNDDQIICLGIFPMCRQRQGIYRIVWTVMRVPVMTGRPLQTSGEMEMRFFVILRPLFQRTWELSCPIFWKNHSWL